MKNEAQETAIDPPLGRSSIDRLPKELREAVNKAIAEGATIDGITALIRGESGACSRSAVGRYAQKYRALIREQQDADRAMRMWVRELGERPEGRAGLILIETMRTMVLGTMAALAERGEPVPTQELARLSLVLKRIEDTDKLRLAREKAAAKEAGAGAEAAAPGAGRSPAKKRQPPLKKGLSRETVALIDEAVLGKARWPVGTLTSVPVDPWNPDESPSSRLIPDNPDESWPEIAPGVFRTSPTSILSLGPGRGGGARPS